MTTPALHTPSNRPEPAAIAWLLKKGDHVGEYTIRKPIGEGSSSIVYEVKNAAGAHFALKLSRFPLAASGKSSILAERVRQSAVPHFMLCDVPNVAHIAAANLLLTPQGALPYLVMELVPGGETITAWAARTTPTLVNLVEVFIDIASALGAMASMKICHRDLKPQNILIAPDDIPKIVDLNSATFPNRKTLTAPAASAIPGTHAYFSPELAATVLDEMRTGKKARYEYAPTDDLYSLGCVFYEVLVGEVPCCDIDASLETILRQIVTEKPPHPVELNRSVPWSVSKVVMKLLNKNPAERYQSGYEVADDLKTARYQTVDNSWHEPFVVPRREATSKLPPWAAPVPSATERLRLRWAAKLGIALGVLVALVAWPIARQDCPPESSAEKGPTVLCKAKMFITTAAVAALSCVGIKKSVHAEDEEWFAQCPAEARETVTKLRMPPFTIASFPKDGPNVRWHDYGYELRAGPVEVHLSTLDRLGGGSVLGEIRIDSDGASVRFTKIQLDHDGEFPVCGMGYGERQTGFRKRLKGEPDMDPDSELRPEQGFIYVERRTLEVLLAR